MVLLEYTIGFQGIYINLMVSMSRQNVINYVKILMYIQFGMLTW